MFQKQTKMPLKEAQNVSADNQLTTHGEYLRFFG